MIINELREQRQLQGIIRWRKNKCRGILAWATGVGKTYGAVLTVKYIEQVRNPTYLIIVPSQTVLKQWKAMFESFFNEEILSRIMFYTVNEVQNSPFIFKIDILIIDEIHEYTTDERIRFVTGEKIECKAILGLTASITEYSFKRVLQYVPIVDEITEQEATENGFIAQFHEFNVQLELTETEKKMYDKITEIFSLQMVKFDNNLDTAQKCLVGGNMYRNGKAKFYTAIQWATTYAIGKGWRDDLNPQLEAHRIIIDLWHPNTIVGYARQLIKAIRDRKHLLEHSVAKYETAIAIIKKFNKVKTIVFSESTAMVDALYDKLSDNEKVVRFHSNLKPILAPSRKTGVMIKKGSLTQKNEAIDDFKTSKARILLSTRAVDKGLNVPDIRLGLTISGSSKTNQYEQRGGRVKRIEEEETTSDSSLFGETKALLINLYLKDTQDEVWIKNRQRHTTHFIYDVTSIDDISYTPPPNDEFIIDF